MLAFLAICLKHSYIKTVYGPGTGNCLLSFTQQIQLYTLTQGAEVVQSWHDFVWL